MGIKDFKKHVFSQVTMYPDSDGKPMADNTLQALWIIMLYDNLRGILDLAQNFVAADHLWYPVEGDPKTRIAPDVMVVLGRPDGYRGSYKQWLEEGMAPQVVFEVLSPSNTAVEMMDKLRFYEKFGVEEFIILDPENGDFKAYIRKSDTLIKENGVGIPWTSPKLGVKFFLQGGELKASHKDGTPFKTFTELKMEKEAALAEIEKLKARLRDLGEEM